MKHIVTKVKLENGAEGLFIDVPGATVMDFEFNFRAGEYLVSREKWEVPHLCEHVLLGANEKYPKARIFQAEFEKNGAYSNAHTSTYHITYESECAEFEWERVFELMFKTNEECKTERSNRALPSYAHDTQYALYCGRQPKRPARSHKENG
jgi:predicted Zn-dependent peptidase